MRIVSALLGGVAFVSAAACAGAAWAQTPEPPAPDTRPEPADILEGDDNRSIIITGSRIRRDPLDQPSPITFLDEEAIDRTGLSSIADVLQRLPSAGGGLNTRFNNSGNFGNPPDGGGVGAGSASIDLRYLGDRRTLVLVDGLRFVNGAAASGVPASVDLNAIPQIMIERIEVLQDGASPIYGSDAIAGVVNIITRQSLRGFDASAQVGGYFEEDDGWTQDYQLAWGTGSDRVNIVVGANYVDQDSVSSADRDISLFPAPFSNSCADGGCSSASPLGRFLVLDRDLALRAPVIGRPPVFDPTLAGGDFRADAGASDRFNFAPFNFVLTPSERYGGFISATAELTDNINARLKAVYNRRESANQAAPLPLFIGPGAGTGTLTDRISIDATNPFNPFGVTLSAGGPGEPPANYIAIFRRFVEIGPRRYSQEVDTTYLTGTLDGTFNLGTTRWFWDVSGVVGFNDARQTFVGNVNAANLQRALGPLSQCTAPCVPFNLFGGEGSITPEQIDYVTFVDNARSEQDLWDVTANVSGELLELPGGPLGLAFGYEHRDNAGSFTPDPVVQAGLGSDIPAQATGGSFNVEEFYAELRAPILGDRPFFDLLEASAAARYSDYSTFGDTTTFKGGLLWKPVPDILLRGSYSEGFRAPGIGELFGTPSRFDQELDDPCVFTAATPANVRQNCIAQGVPPTGALQPNPQLSVVTGGNPELEPESSESWNFGVVVSPEFIRRGFLARADLEVNYYSIELDDAIQAIGADVLLNRCAQTGDELSCSAVSRAAGGSVSLISGLLQNIGAIETRGIDAVLNIRTRETSLGSFGLYWANSFLLDYTEIVPATEGETEIEREGTERGSPDQAYPEYKAYATLDWALGDFAAAVTGRYISAVQESQADNRLRSRFYTDLQATYRPSFLDRRLGFTVGVNNLFDLNPPGCISCGLNNFDPTTYDVPGRFGYVRLNFEFQ